MGYSHNPTKFMTNTHEVKTIATKLSIPGFLNPRHPIRPTSCNPQPVDFQIYYIRAQPSYRRYHKFFHLSYYSMCHFQKLLGSPCNFPRKLVEGYRGKLKEIMLARLSRFKFLCGSLCCMLVILNRSVILVFM